MGLLHGEVRHSEDAAAIGQLCFGFDPLGAGVARGKLKSPSESRFVVCCLTDDSRRLKIESRGGEFDHSF